MRWWGKQGVCVSDLLAQTIENRQTRERDLNHVVVVLLFLQARGLR
jgi:hypothetical protein